MLSQQVIHVWQFLIKSTSYWLEYAVIQYINQTLCFKLFHLSYYRLFTHENNS